MKEQSTYSNVFLENALLLNNLQGGIVYSEFGPPFYLRYVTEGMVTLSGYTQEELIGMEQMDLVCKEDEDFLTQEVARQFALGDTFEIEYRLKRKDGSFIYVLDRAKVVTHDDGQKYIHCLMTDISDLKEMEQNLRLSQEKYKLAIQQSGNVIFEYNISNHILRFSENYTSHFHGETPCGTLDQIIEQGWIAAEDKSLLLDAFQQCNQGQKRTAFELRVRDGENHFAWCTVSLAPISHLNDHIYAVVGCLRNIDAEKHQLEYLTELSQKDGLTGVYNRVTMERIIESHLKETSKALHVFMVIDVDFFKQVNDKQGHACGDDVLIQLADAMQVALPPSAFLGRLGGDEFLIFIPNLQSEDEVVPCAKRIFQGVQERFQKYHVGITISMGIACSKNETNTFKELYKKADEALYIRKKNGKNSYGIYGE